MGTSHLKTAAITNLDATPPTASSSGEGAPGRLVHADGYVTAVAADAAGSTYQLARVPTNAKVKAVILESEAQGAGKVQVGLYYSSSPSDGTPPANQGTVVSGCVNLFAQDVDLTSAYGPTNVTNQNGAFTLDKRLQPLWQAAGLSSDPGGFFDIVATVHTTAITTGTGKVGARVEYVM